MPTTKRLILCIKLVERLLVATFLSSRHETPSKRYSATLHSLKTIAVRTVGPQRNRYPRPGRTRCRRVGGSDLGFRRLGERGGLDLGGCHTFGCGFPQRSNLRLQVSYLLRQWIGRGLDLLAGQARDLVAECGFHLSHKSLPFVSGGVFFLLAIRNNTH